MPTLNEKQHKLVVGIATGQYTPTEAHEELNKIIDSVKAEAHQAGVRDAMEVVDATCEKICGSKQKFMSNACHHLPIKQALSTLTTK